MNAPEPAELTYQSVSVSPRSLNPLSFPSQTKEKSQDTVTPSDIINKLKSPQRDEAASQPAAQPASLPAIHPATIFNRLLEETHTDREANVL